MAGQEKLPRRRRWLIAAAVLLFIFASVAMLYWFAFLRGWTVAKIEHLVGAEIPVGSPRPEVEASLKKLGIKHSYFHDVTKGNIASIHGQTLPQRAGLAERDLSGMVEWVIDDANVDLFHPSYIYVYFFFDREERLVGHLVLPLVLDQSHLTRWLAPAPSNEPAAK
jgi:hypothetical protein